MLSNNARKTFLAQQWCQAFSICEVFKIMLSSFHKKDCSVKIYEDCEECNNFMQDLIVTRSSLEGPFKTYGRNLSGSKS